MRHETTPGIIGRIIRREISRGKKDTQATPSVYPTFVGGSSVPPSTEDTSYNALDTHNSDLTAHGGVQQEVEDARTGVYQSLLAHLQAIWAAIGLNTAKRHDRTHTLNSSGDHTGQLALSQLPSSGLTKTTGGATFTNGLFTGGDIAAGSNAFDAGHLFAIPGYQCYSDGFIVQWGIIDITSGTRVTFPIPFPTACLSALAINTQSSTMSPYIPVSSMDADGMDVRIDTGSTSAHIFRWEAKGN